jgi:peroxiredoxin
MQFNIRIALMVGVGVISMGCATTRTVPTELPHEILKTSMDAEFELSSLKGDVVLMDFWATWCKPCRFALPAYAKLHDQFAKSGLKVVAISVDHDVAALGHYLRRNPMPFPVLKDQEGRFAQLMGVTKMPTTFLIDRRGKIRAFFPGFGSAMLDRLKKQLQKLLVEKI